MAEDFNALFLAHRRELHAYISQKLEDPAIAEDLAQETFLRFFKFRTQNPALAITHARAYLYRIAHRLAIDHLRAAPPEPVESLAAHAIGEIEDHGPQPDQLASDLAELERIQAALLELPERTRRIFVLARIEGLTYPEVARRLGISASAVQKHLSQATRYVMQRLRRDAP